MSGGLVVDALNHHLRSSALGRPVRSGGGDLRYRKRRDLWAKPIGGSLQCCHVVDSQKRIIVLAAGDLAPNEFLLNEGVAIEVVGDLEW